jgi:hypothetical protein
MKSTSAQISLSNARPATLDTAPLSHTTLDEFAEIIGKEMGRNEGKLRAAINKTLDQIQQKQFAENRELRAAIDALREEISTLRSAKGMVTILPHDRRSA